MPDDYGPYYIFLKTEPEFDHFDCRESTVFVTEDPKLARDIVQYLKIQFGDRSSPVYGFVKSARELGPGATRAANLCFKRLVEAVEADAITDAGFEACAYGIAVEMENERGVTGQSVGVDEPQVNGGRDRGQGRAEVTAASNRDEEESPTRSRGSWLPPQEVLARFARIQPKTTEELEQAGFKNFVARSEAARRAASAALKYLKQQGPILIVAPTGCGKEILVRDLHGIRNQSKELNGEVRNIPCSGLNSDPGFSRLVGHVKGAFTGANQDKEGLLELGGAGLFGLDEFHALSEQRQQDLLRILDPQYPEYSPVGATEPARQVEAKIVASTSEDLWKLVAKQRFHGPLLRRFGQRIVWIPPLPGRREDVIEICERYLREKRPDLKYSPKELQAVADLAEQQSWDGRELDSLLDNDTASTLAEMFPEIESVVGTFEEERLHAEELLRNRKGNRTQAGRDYFPDDPRTDDAIRMAFTRKCKFLGVDLSPTESR